MKIGQQSRIAVPVASVWNINAADQWGGVVWQHPANDWGDANGGFNLTGAKKLTFWARGEKGGEKVSFEFGLLGAIRSTLTRVKASWPM
jgi:hypothetical protein